MTTAARQALAQAGALLDAAGLSPGTTGNLSVRHGDAVIATPTSARLGDLDPNALSILTPDGTHIDGPRPTKETFMHLAAYSAASDIGAVVHLHSPYATAASCLAGLDRDDAIPALTPYLTMRGGRAALLKYFAPGDAALAAPVAERVRAGYRVMLLSNHGSLVAAADLPSATALAQELEESARIMFITMGATVRHLDAAQVAALDRIRATS